MAYFVDGAAVQGTAEFEANLWGAVWRFRNEGNRASFLAHPEVYGPQFGGYDPVDIARGVVVAGNPRFYVIAAQRLYLFSREDNRDAFAADPERFLYEVGKRWPALQDTAQSVAAVTAAGIAPGDELRDDEAGVAALAESELAALAVGDLAAGRRHDRVARPDVPFARSARSGDRCRRCPPRSGRI